MLYQTTDDRKILRLRDAKVLEVRAAPRFFLRLTGDVELDFTGEVVHTLGPRTPDAHRRLLSEFSQHELSELISAAPASWVVFNTGAQRIVFSNRWHLTMTPKPGDSWRLDLGDGEILTYPTS
ncbi:hypothetical protein ACFQHO_31140 [Actinomadura yumaensis]|nr:hypothetical protein [Actinomadura sp. J1-007]